MKTLKVVIIGDSGVGKTSFRTQYISGKFLTGYRATIGTDFITRTLPHHRKANSSITLQIWDTAGQERFASLSAPFFRGADAVVMMYDVNRPPTLQALRKWWREFQMRAPVTDDEAADFAIAVVGNKVDLAESAGEGWNMSVSEEEAREFWNELVPVEDEPGTPTQANVPRTEVQPASPSEPDTDTPPSPVAPINELEVTSDDDELTSPIAVSYDSRILRRQRSESHGTSRWDTVASSRSGRSVYYTPSSSVFDEFESAPSSPIHSTINSLSSTPRNPPPHKRTVTNISTSSSSAATVTPSLFDRRESSADSPLLTPPPPPPLKRGPQLFLASAKTGHSVSAVFEYLARHVLDRWEREERERHIFDSAERIDNVVIPDATKDSKRSSSKCCS